MFRLLSVNSVNLTFFFVLSVKYSWHLDITIWSDSFFLDPGSVRNLSLGATWNVIKGAGFEWFRM